MTRVEQTKSEHGVFVAVDEQERDVMLIAHLSNYKLRQESHIYRVRHGDIDAVSVCQTDAINGHNDTLF